MRAYAHCGAPHIRAVPCHAAPWRCLLCRAVRCCVTGTGRPCPHCGPSSLLGLGTAGSATTTSLRGTIRTWKDRPRSAIITAYNVHLCTFCGTTYTSRHLPPLGPHRASAAAMLSRTVPARAVCEWASPAGEPLGLRAMLAPQWNPTPRGIPCRVGYHAVRTAPSALLACSNGSRSSVQWTSCRTLQRPRC